MKEKLHQQNQAQMLSAGAQNRLAATAQQMSSCSFCWERVQWVLLIWRCRYFNRKTVGRKKSYQVEGQRRELRVQAECSFSPSTMNSRA